MDPFMIIKPESQAAQDFRKNQNGNDTKELKIKTVVTFCPFYSAA